MGLSSLGWGWSWWRDMIGNFRRQPWCPDDGDYDPVEWDSRANEAYDRLTGHIDDYREGIRKLTFKGNTAGALAALTLTGSQIASAGPAKMSAYCSLCFFVLGLTCYYVRQWLMLQHTVIRRESIAAGAKGDLGDTFDPPPVIMDCARFCDGFAVLALAVGMMAGMLSLYVLVAFP